MLNYDVLFDVAKKEAIESGKLMYKLPEKKSMFEYFVFRQTIFNFNVYTNNKAF